MFHVSLLEPDDDNPLEGQQQPEPPPVIIDGYDEFEVEEILDAKITRRKLKFRAKWNGETRLDTTWYPATNYENSPEIVLDFYRKYPDKPRDEWVENLEKKKENDVIYDSITVKPREPLPTNNYYAPLQVNAARYRRGAEPRRSFGLEEGGTVMNDINYHWGFTNDHSNLPIPRDYIDHSYDSDSSTSTIPDYHLAWLCYRRHYLEEEARIRQIAYAFWYFANDHLRHTMQASYEHAVTRTVLLRAPRMGIRGMRLEGWNHIEISPEHLYAREL